MAMQTFDSISQINVETTRFLGRMEVGETEFRMVNNVRKGIGLDVFKALIIRNGKM